VNALLAEHGNEIVAMPKTGANEAYVGALISDAGTTDDGSADYFVFNSGRLQVSDTSASFRPLGSSEIHQVDQKAIDQPAASLSVSEIDQVMASLEGGKLNPTQRAALPKYLADPSQQFIAKGQISKTGLAAYTYAEAEDVTYITASTGGWIQMDSAGNVIGTASKPNAMWARGGGGLGVQKSATLLLTVENLLSVLLSIGLFLTCLGALRYAPKTRGRYMLYAVVKIATVVVGGFGVYQLTRSAGWSGTGMLTTIYMATGLVFPILALILVQTRGVRNFFVAQGG